MASKPLPPSRRATSDAPLTATADLEPTASPPAPALAPAASADPHNPHDPHDHHDSARPRLGRYVLIERIGIGGTSQVYAAHDPVLERTVALKVLRPDVGQHAHRGNRRLLREAKAIARLSHPNIVTVYDAGQLGAELFIAMELIDGCTLRQWLAESRRTWREIVGVYIDAGRGLVAAHEAGLVHRDFKPDNVLIGADQRVRVLDFGLVVPSGSSASGSRGGSAAPELAAGTDAVGVMGTPRYMAPEQHLGRRTDARTDQYSFCVALYESLYGHYPFGDAASLSTMRERKLAGDMAPAPRTEVPARIRRAVLRGMHCEPAQRWPTMTALLDELERARRPVLRNWPALAAVALALLALGAAGLWHAGRAGQAAVCADGPQQLADVWNPAIRSAARSAFLASKVPHAAATWSRLEPLLDQYAQRWVAQYTDACAATNVHQVQSAELFGRRMACLGRSRRQLASLVRFLGNLDSELVSHVVRAAYELPNLDDCASTGALMAQVPLPAAPALRQRVQALGEQLATMQALFNAGQYTRVQAMGQALSEQAAALDYLPLRAELYFLRGRTAFVLYQRDAAAALLEQAIWAAEASGHDEIAAAALAHLYATLGDKMPAELGDRVEAAIRRSGKEQYRALIANSQGIRAFAKGDYQGALDGFERALAHNRAALGPDHPDGILFLGNISVALMQQRRYAEAAERLGSAWSFLDRTLGLEHPHSVLLGSVEAKLLMAQGRYREALERADKVLVTSRLMFGPEHRYTVGALSMRAMMHTELGQSATVEQDLQQAIAAYGRAGGDKQSEEYVSAHVYWSRHLAQTGRVEEALGLLERALATRKEHGLSEEGSLPLYRAKAQVLLARGDRARAHEILEGTRALEDKALPPGDPDRAETLQLMGMALAQQERCGRQAMAHYRRAVEIFERSLGPAHPRLGWLLVEIGQCELDASRPGEARALAQQALTALAQAEPTQRDVVRARELLARTERLFEHSRP